MEQLQTALSALKVLRSSVSQVFYSLTNGVKVDHGEDGKENKYILELQELLTNIGTNLRDVEQSINSLNPPPGPFHLGNTAYLAQEITQERQALYSTLVNSYKWTDKTQEYSNAAHQILSQNSLKRTAQSYNRQSRKTRSQQAHTYSPQQVDPILTMIDRLYNDMSITITRPYTTNVVLHITLAHIFKAIVSFKGIMIERVVVKGFNEQLDLWSESRYKIFQRITDHAHATMLHYYNPNFPEMAVKMFFSWLHSYVSLGSDSCKRCGAYLYNGLPPTWRDHKSLDPYHFECKP